MILPNRGQSVADTDLVPVVSVLTEEENGLSGLVRADEYLRWRPHYHDAFEVSFKTNGWNEALVSELLTNNSVCSELVSRALVFKGIQIPHELVVSNELSQFGNWGRFAFIKTIQAEQAARNQDWNLSTNILKEVFVFGKKVQDSGSSLSVYYRGKLIKIHGYRSIRRLAGLEDISLEQLEGLAALLEVYRPDEAALKNAIKHEYQTEKQRLIKMHSGEWNPDSSKWEKRLYAFTTRPFFNLGKTLQILADESSNFIRSVETNRIHYSVTGGMNAFSNRSILGHAMNRNLIGEIHLGLGLFRWDKVIDSKSSEINSFTATQIILALRCYQLEQGVLPQTLDVLVPKYLSRVPTDDFDGQPFRYLPDKKLLYSVGEDLQDDGGVSHSAGQKLSDDVFPIHL